MINIKYTKYLWEKQILPYWTHHNRPKGQRFLGSIQIQRQLSDRLLSFVSQSLKKLNTVTYKSLYDDFFDPEKTWLKIITLVISEYAYYYSSERFWQGFCEHLNITHSQGVENTFRQIVDEGINILGLIQAKGGYKYVSTLWLQSGVPYQNLDHFARLVQEVTDEYGWWELAHTPPEDIAQELLQWCDQKHPQWGTLNHFLKSSYSEKEETEPISGRLVQGIALVAGELERQQVSPIVLKDKNEREKLLGNNYLPDNFFFRDWNALIQVLIPRYSFSRRSIASWRSKSIYLYLDVTDSLNTQLILPEQTIWKPEWKNLRGTYCVIPEANWENNIPREGCLEIPELAINIKKVSNQWSCQLQNHYCQPIQTWKCEGIYPQLPCLIFDAIAGKHLLINPSNTKIVGVEEIIYFTPKEVTTEFTDGIKILDNYIPSSIEGWIGQHLILVKSEASIRLKVFADEQTKTIIWQLREPEQPHLQGLRLKGKKLTYIEAPTFWYPPHTGNINLNILIEDITRRTIISRSVETLTPNKSWSEIKLSQWITQPNQYETKFWFEQHQWSYRFKVQSNYSISQFQETQQFKIVTRSGHSETNLPVKYNCPEQFWAEIINFEKLYPLEEVIFILTNSNEQVFYQSQAGALGTLTLDVSVLYDLLPESNCYFLDCQRSGSMSQRLLEMNIAPQVINWSLEAISVCFSGLQNGKIYSLSCWNLLVPNKESEIIKVPLVESDLTKIIVPLALPPGIYHLQLYCSLEIIENIGIWYGIDRDNLPEEILINEDLANYCYTILDNESVDVFLSSFKKLNLDLSLEQIELIIFSLKNHKYYLPEWMDLNGFLNKIEELSRFLSSSHQTTKNVQNNFREISRKNKDELKNYMSEKWYLVTVKRNKRKLFLTCLEERLKKKQLQNLIIKYEIPCDSVLEDIVLVRLSDFKLASTHIRDNPEVLTVNNT